MSVSSTNLSGNNVTAFNRYRRLAAEKARAEAEAAERAKAEAEAADKAEAAKKTRTKKQATKDQKADDEVKGEGGE